MCPPANDGIEGTEHFLLLCPSFVEPCRDRLAGVFASLGPFEYTNLQIRFLMQIVLHDYKSFRNEINREMLLLILQFIQKFVVLIQISFPLL